MYRFLTAVAALGISTCASAQDSESAFEEKAYRMYFNAMREYSVCEAEAIRQIKTDGRTAVDCSALLREALRAGDDWRLATRAVIDAINKKRK